MKNWVDILSSKISKHLINIDATYTNEITELRRDLRSIREELRNTILPDKARKRKMDSWVLNNQKFKLEKKESEKQDHGSVL